MRIRPAGALELSRRAGAQSQQRWPGQYEPEAVSTPVPVAVAQATAAAAAVPATIVRHLGVAQYLPTWQAMQRFTAERSQSTADEIWFLEHPPVFTLGVNASRAHLIAPGDIP